MYPCSGTNLSRIPRIYEAMGSLRYGIFAQWGIPRQANEYKQSELVNGMMPGTRKYQWSYQLSGVFVHKLYA